MDGKLDDEAWKAAEFVNNFESTSPGFDSEMQPTELAVAYDDDNLYLAFVCHEGFMDNVSTPAHPLKVQESWQGNNVFVRIYADRDYTRYQLLEVPSLDPADTNYSPLPWEGKDLKTAITYGTDRWIVEIAIPWKSLGRKPKPGDVWGLGPGRQRNRIGVDFAYEQYTVWGLPYPLPRPFDHWGFMGYVRFE